MSSGAEHYREAERLVALAALDGPDPRDPLIVAAAHVHATLALAAATYDAGTLRDRPNGSALVRRSWAHATADRGVQT